MAIGTPSATTSSPIVGLRNTTLPQIVITGSTLSAGTVVTFTPAGSSTAISGTFTGNSTTGQYVTDNGSLIPLTATLGATNGVLKSAGQTDVNVPTAFTASIGTPLATTSAPLTGAIGGQFPLITITGSTLSNGTAVTFTPAGSSTAITGTFNGTISTGYFVPTGFEIYDYQIIPAGSTLGAANGVFASANATNVNVPTAFIAFVPNYNNSSFNSNCTVVGLPTSSPLYNNSFLVFGATFANFPIVGNPNKLYIATTTSLAYWYNQATNAYSQI